MDLLTHIVSGAAVSTVVAGFAVSKPVSMKCVLFAGALGGAFPDIDAISLWSKFDATFGKWLGLAHSGKEIYFGKFWYSHHGFFHSVAAAVITGFLLGCLACFFRWMRRKRRHSFLCFFKINTPVYLAFVLGCISHAAGDFPTPASVWGGVRLFWPVNNYTGGWGDIWWWNNYDIFLIISICTLLNIGTLLSANFIRFRAGIVTLFIAIIAFAGTWHQAATREYDYAYTGHTQQYSCLEKQSGKEQERILGKKIYRMMSRLDKWLPLNF